VTTPEEEKLASDLLDQVNRDLLDQVNREMVNAEHKKRLQRLLYGVIFDAFCLGAIFGWALARKPEPTT
jgi:uncharacterized membrane protein YoaK (UPF0700 family)